MPWVKRVGGLVRGYGSKSATRTEWLDLGHPDLVEYAKFLEDQTNPTPERRASRVLTGPKERVLFKALFKLENRVRALEGEALLTKADYTALAKASYFEEFLNG